jgi:hypothetical protein
MTRYAVTRTETTTLTVYVDAPDAATAEEAAAVWLTDNDITDRPDRVVESTTEATARGVLAHGDPGGVLLDAHGNRIRPSLSS